MTVSATCSVVILMASGMGNGIGSLVIRMWNVLVCAGTWTRLPRPGRSLRIPIGRTSVRLQVFRIEGERTSVLFRFFSPSVSSNTSRFVKRGRITSHTRSFVNKSSTNSSMYVSAYPAAKRHIKRSALKMGCHLFPSLTDIPHSQFPIIR